LPHNQLPPVYAVRFEKPLPQVVTLDGADPACFLLSRGSRRNRSTCIRRRCPQTARLRSHPAASVARRTTDCVFV